MRKIETNYHTHTYYCGHAGGTVKDYCIEAIKKGIKVIGFSEHAPIARIPGRMSMDNFKQFLSDIDECKTLFSEQLTILKGLEIEYFRDDIEGMKNLKNELDYMIIGAHYYNCGPDMANKSTYSIKTKEQLNEYADYLCEAMKSGLFEFVAHPDLFMLSYPVFDEECEKISQKITVCAKELNLPLELNANGIRRGLTKKPDGMHYPYPRNEFWEIAQKNGCKVIINSDCHDPKYLLDECMYEAYELASELKLDLITKI